MSAVALILAAGSASRFGSAKQGARIDGVSLVRRAVLAALECDLPVVVVTGAHADVVCGELADLAFTRVHNPSWADGMGSSLACGVRALDADVPAILVCLADQPRVQAAQLRALFAVHAREPDRIVAADHGATLGPPCLFPRRYRAELAALAGVHGAKKVLQAHAADVIAVPMPEAAIDIDTPADLDRLAPR